MFYRNSNHSMSSMQPRWSLFGVALLLVLINVGCSSTSLPQIRLTTNTSSSGEDNSYRKNEDQQLGGRSLPEDSANEPISVGGAFLYCKTDDSLPEQKDSIPMGCALVMNQQRVDLPPTQATADVYNAAQEPFVAKVVPLEDHELWNWAVYAPSSMSLTDARVEMMLGFNAAAPIVYESMVEDMRTGSASTSDFKGIVRYTKVETQLLTVYNASDEASMLIPATVKVTDSTANMALQVQFIVDDKIEGCDYMRDKNDDLVFESCDTEGLKVGSSVKLKKLAFGLVMEKGKPQKDGEIRFESKITRPQSSGVIKPVPVSIPIGDKSNE